MPDPKHADDAAVNVETHHESTDVNVKAIVWFVVIFIAFAAVTHAGLWLLYRFYIQIGRGAAANAPMTSVARSADANVPSVPRLQPFPSRDPHGEVIPPMADTPVTDMEAMRTQQEAVLNSYGWVDQTRGIVHVPIDEAKKLALAGDIYKVNSGATAPATTQTAGGGQSAPAASTTAVTNGQAPAPGAIGTPNGPPK